jgi:hypothetical protein
LPAAERPLRTAELDLLLADAVRAVRRVGDTGLVLLLDPAPRRAELLQDLARRESECCPFFTVTLSDDAGGALRLVVDVPPAHAEGLAGLAVLAALAERGQSRRLATGTTA